MVKQKRNGNGGASEFTGFAAFASHQSSAAAAVQLARVNGTESAHSSLNKEKRLKPNPIYAGSDSQLSQIFKRITKKDATTKSRALSDLVNYAFPCNDSGNATATLLQKNEQVSVLSHFFYLLANKLIHENNSLVRKGALKVLGNSTEHVPKACNSLLRQDASLDSVGAIGNLIGWTYSCQSSQIAEESKLASQVWNSVFAVLKKFNGEDIEGYVKWCIVSHAEAILQSSSRAATLAAALSVSKKKINQPSRPNKGGKGKAPSKLNEASGGASESEKEDIEERHERVVLLTLRSLCVLFREHPEIDKNDFRYADIFNDSAVLYKHFSSQKGSFRRATFGLVSCVLQNSISLVHDKKKKSNLPLLLMNALSSERDIANFASLFEMILLFIASFRKFDGGIQLAWVNKDNEHGYCRGIDLNAFVKSLSKLLKKACYGSSSLQWGPMILPILATMQSSDHHLQIVKSLWSGRTAAVGTADAMAIVVAVVECSMYLLVQNNGNDSEGKGEEADERLLAIDLAQFFLDCLSFYLNTPSRGSSSMDSEKNLCSTLVRDIYKLDQLPSGRKTTKFYLIQTWFWNEGLATVLRDMNATSTRRLYNLLNGLAKGGTNNSVTEAKASFSSTMKTTLWNTIIPSCDPSPGKDQLSLLISIFRLCSVGFIFDTNIKEIEAFCKDTLISWISLSDLSANGPSVELMFELLFDIMISIDKDTEAIKQIWEYCLQHILSRVHALELLIVGLNVLGAKYDSLLDLLQCPAFDEYAISIANLSESSRHEYAGTNNFDIRRAETELSFFRLSAGIDGRATKSLVSSQTVSSWQSIALSKHLEYGIYEERHALLEVLFSIGMTKSQSIDRDTLLKLAIRSWKEGGPTWTSSDLTGILASDESLRLDLLSSCSKILKRELKEEMEPLRTSADLYCYHWAERASRAIDIYHQYLGDGDFLPLQFVGFYDIDVWAEAMSDYASSKCDSMYLCFMYMAQKYSGDIFAEAEHTPLLGLYILMTFVTFVSSDKTKRCENLRSLSGNVFEEEDIEPYIIELVRLLEQGLAQENRSKLFIKRAVIILDWLLELLTPKFVPLKEFRVCDNIDQSDIKEGDELWYIPDATNTESERVKVTVAKIHTDDFPNLYFSINMPSGSEHLKTKQTVSSRLKRFQYSPGQTNNAPTPVHSTMVSRIEELIMSKLVRPLLIGSSVFAREMAAEIFNSVISHCGLQGKSGIGSIRFEAFKLLSNMEQELLGMFSALQQDFNERSLASVAVRLKNLAIVLGYGTITSRSYFNCQIFKYNGKSVIDALIHMIREDTSILNESPHLCHGLLMWIAVSSSAAVSEENASDVWEMMENITSFTVNEPSSALLTLDGIDAMKKAVMHITVETKAVTLASEQACVSNLFKQFVEYDESILDSCHIGEYFVDDSLVPEAEFEPFWIAKFRGFITTEIRNDSGTIPYLARVHAEELVQCLSSPVKQWVSFHILHFSASKSGILYAEDDVELTDETNEKLDGWMIGLEEEEALEIEDDVMISAQWFPRGLMTSLESWTDTSILNSENDGRDERAFITRVLQWLLALEYLDAAGAVDMRNRSHITSYIDKTSAIKEVFDITMLFTELKEQQTDLFECISIDNRSGSFSLSHLCTLAFFRSIESMPTLCKSWWNDECPRSLQTEINTFVENMVAPETLKRELRRIKNSSDLGELDVNGSCVSREVIATYMQDECKLSVTIRVPPSFPLRNAEVDCQKTLGISEKRWRYWSLQIMRMLNNQDGSVLDALLLWKQNVDKEFDGVEPCPVCYSVLCVKTHAMPNLECKNCHNRFHSSCLYKWFNSSGKNQCVLCQQPWSGTKVL